MRLEIHPFSTQVKIPDMGKRMVSDELSFLKGLNQYQPIWNNADTTTITGLTGTNKWYGGVLGPDGKIYGIPYNSASVLIIDPVAGTADTTTITGLTGSYKWRGVLGPDGKIYGIPHSSGSVLIIDPVAGTADTTTITGLTGAGKWLGGVLGPDGKIYGIPFNSDTVLIISGGFPSIPITPLLSPYLNKF